MSAGPPAAGYEIAGLILAAGESSRMGRDKALLLYRGRTFLENIVARLREAGISRIAVVLGHHAEAIRRAVDLSGIEVVVNRDYQRGQTSSLQAGLTALLSPAAELDPVGPGRVSESAPVILPPGGTGPREEPLSKQGSEDLKAIVLCLVDHPAFGSETVAALLAAFARTQASLVMPGYQGRRGHPVLIARPLFEPLLDIDPGRGANTVIHAWHENVQTIEVADPGILSDIDDPEDYVRLV